MEALLEASAGRAPVRQTSRYERFVGLLSQPRATVGIAALAFVMSLPAIAIGLTADDYDLAFAVMRDPLSAYAFLPRDASVRHAHVLAARYAGRSPWWSDLDFHQAFFRPLSSLSLALDFTLWPSAPWLMHIENSLAFALIVLVAASLYKALGLTARTRGLATLFFAAAAAQSMTTGWISGRNTLLATLFGFIAVRLFVAARSGGGLRMLALSALSFVAALLSAEVGVSAVAYIIAYALCIGTQPAQPPASDARVLAGRPPLGAQIPALAPFGIAIAAWLTFYKIGGYGVQNSGFYIDPTHDPGRFVANVAYGAPIYLASQLTVPFAAFAAVAPLAAPIIAAVSLAILYVSRRLWLPWVTADSRGRVLGLGALLATLPLGGSPPQDRMVSFVALGVCGLCAMFIDERLSARGASLPQKGARRLLRFHAIVAPLLYVPYLFGAMTMVAGGGGLLLDRTLGDDPRPVVLVNTPSFLPAHFFAEARQWRGEPHPTIDVLYGGGTPLELTRTGERTLQLTAAKDNVVAGSIIGTGRASPSNPLHLNEVIPGERMRTQVLDVKAGVPTRVRFDFIEPLESMRIYSWQGRRLELLPLPAIGQRTQIQPPSMM